MAQSIWACQQRMRAKARDNFICREKKKKRIARQTKMKRVQELPRLRKRNIKSERGREGVGKGEQDIVKMTAKIEE